MSSQHVNTSHPPSFLCHRWGRWEAADARDGFPDRRSGQRLGLLPGAAGGIPRGALQAQRGTTLMRPPRNGGHVGPSTRYYADLWVTHLELSFFSSIWICIFPLTGLCRWRSTLVSTRPNAWRPVTWKTWTWGRPSPPWWKHGTARTPSSPSAALQISRLYFWRGTFRTWKLLL